jgi:hypothetical protein
MEETLHLKDIQEEEQQPLLQPEDNTATETSRITRPVLVISILYAVVAFQMLYFDGNCTLLRVNNNSLLTYYRVIADMVCYTKECRRPWI